MLIFALALIATFLALPWAEGQTIGFVLRHTAGWYGVEHASDIRLAWRILLALVIFAAIRAVLKLAFSAASLALAMRILAAARRR